MEVLRVDAPTVLFEDAVADFGLGLQQLTLDERALVECTWRKEKYVQTHKNRNFVCESKFKQ